MSAAAWSIGASRPADPRAALAAALAEPDPDRTARALRRLRRDWPDWDEPAVRLGQLHRSRGETSAAQLCYAAALGLNPARTEALLAAGAMHLAAGAADRAEPLLRRCCGVAPNDAAAHHAWGLALLMLGRHDDAYEVLSKGQALDPGNALCAVHLADSAHAVGRDPACLALFEDASRADPCNAGPLTGIAASLAHLGRRADAIDTLEATTLLHPDASVAVAMFADMLARTTRQMEAEKALRRALALDPDSHDASMALSVVLMRLHRHSEARTVLQDLLDRGAERMGPLCNMATVLVALGQVEEAVACARQAIALKPDHPAPYRALCNALPYLDGVNGATLLRATQDCGARQPRAPAPRVSAVPASDRPLRIGLLSGMFRCHPVGWLTVAAFEQLDPAAFDLVCLTPNAPEDAIGRRFAAIAAWHDTGSLDDYQLAERIRALGVDILIDLGGYGDFGRLPVCALRAAPVQIKWVGMQNHSTGLAEMDWFITDGWETPPQLAPCYSERLLVMRDGYVCYTPPPDAPDVAPPPSVTRGHVTFGCYNNLAKITPRVIATWATILTRVPDSRLALKTHQFNDAACREALVRAFAAHGIAPARLSLRGSSPHRELLAQYADIDIVLDPFPYSGGLTTCEALWMGVPTLTMPGETFASRHSTSHMTNVGLADWVVPDLAAYVDAAVARAGDVPALAALRAGLRDRTRHSPLCDAPRFGASLAAGLRHAWREWCTGNHQHTPDLHIPL